MDGRPGRIRPFARLPLSMITLLRRLLVFSCALVCGALGAEPAPLRTALLGWEPVPARPDIQRVAADLVASDFAKTTLALAAANFGLRRHDAAFDGEPRLAARKPFAQASAPPFWHRCSGGNGPPQPSKRGKVATPVGKGGKRFWRGVAASAGASAIGGQMFGNESLSADDGAIREMPNAAAQDGRAWQLAFCLNGGLEVGGRNGAFAWTGAGADAEKGEAIIRLGLVPRGEGFAAEDDAEAGLSFYAAGHGLAVAAETVVLGIRD